jgi:hypothetical protein
MDGSRFDALVQSFLGSRRSLLAGGLGVGMLWRPMVTGARKKRKRKKRNPQARPNEFGCLEVGDPCKSAAQCCSGVCEDKRCRAHDTGRCDQGLVKETCLAATPEDMEVLRCDNDPDCACYRTTSGSRYCSAFLENEGDPRCADCRSDADCVALGFPPEAACAPVSRGICAGACPTGMACLVPCGVEFTGPIGR